MSGRPAPFMVFHAMEATGVTDVRRVLVAGDTVRDVESGQNAGAAVVIAVRTGEVPAETLAAAGPTHVLGGVTDIPGLLANLA
jgi:phosphoglycolate phosphatase-like HAD superfamily hydrolase